MDAVELCFMSPGHAKCGPDCVSRNTAGEYNRSDTFNTSQLIHIIPAFASTQVYGDDEILREYKLISAKRFGKVRYIKSFQ